MPVIRRVQSSRAPRSNVSFALEAERFLALGQVARAVEICKRGLGSFPEHPAGYVTLARAYFKLGEADRALNVLRDGYRRSGSKRLTALYRKLSGDEDAPRAEDADAFKTIPEITATELADLSPDELPNQISVDPVDVNVGLDHLPEIETSHALNAMPALAEPEIAEPEILEPEIVEPEILEPEILEPEILEPEIVEPEIMEPEILEPEILEPEILEPEIVEPEIVEPEILEPEILEPEIMEPEILEPEIVEPELLEPELLEPEILEPEIVDPRAAESIEASEPIQAPENAHLSDIDALDRLAARLDREHPPASALTDAGGEPVTYGEDDDSIALPEISALDMETAPIPLPPEEALEITTILQELGLGPLSAERVEYEDVTAVEEPPAPVESDDTISSPGEPFFMASASRQDVPEETATHMFPQPERPRPLSLALHLGKSISRLRSSNLRLIPGLEFAPLRHEDQFRGQSIAPLINEPMPQPELPVRQRRISDSPVFLPLPTLDSTGMVAAEDIPPVRAERQQEPVPHEEPEELDIMEVPEELESIHIPVREVPAPEPEPEPVKQQSIRAEPGLELPKQIIQADPEPDPEPQKLTPLEELARRLENARIPVVEDYEQRPVFEPSIVSDTLANILVAQRAYAEAMQAFQTLARVKPERFEYYQRKIWEMKYMIQNPGMPWPPVEE
ncbi:MAG: tetratricopeptide repeat protein [Bacteroidota bacterium]